MYIYASFVVKCLCLVLLCIFNFIFILFAPHSQAKFLVETFLTIKLYLVLKKSDSSQLLKRSKRDVSPKAVV